MKKTYKSYGLLLTAITIALFLIVYYFFMGLNYYSTSVKINVSLLTALYVVVPVLLLKNISKVRNFTFVSAFKTSFFTMCIGGTLSILFIVLFLSIIDPEAGKILQQQRIESYITNLQAEYQSIKQPEPAQTQQYYNILKGLKSEQIQKDNFANFKNITIFLASIYLFYTIISIFLAIFFKKRNATNHSHTLVK